VQANKKKALRTSLGERKNIWQGNEAVIDRTRKKKKYAGHATRNGKNVSVLVKLLLKREKTDPQKKGKRGIRRKKTQIKRRIPSLKKQRGG